MAIIYSKVSGQCLLLGPREALIYPFDVGNYQEVRFGMLFSMVSTGGPNSAYTTETINDGSSKSRFYVGFKDSSQNFPITTGSSFIGNASLSYANDGTNNTNTILNSTDSSIITLTSGGLYSSSIYSISGVSGVQVFSGHSVYLNGPIRIPSSSETVSTTNYMSFLGGRLIQTGNTFSYNYTYTTNKYSTGDQLTIRNLISGFPAPSPTLTGIFSGTKLNSLFVYTPFTGNQIRIHGIVVDRYA